MAFDLLSNRRRRHVLRVVGATDETTLGELAERIAARENDTPRASLRSRERKRVYIALYQVHLPRLAEAGVIEFDTREKSVRPGDNLQEVLAIRRAWADRGDARAVDDAPTDASPTLHLKVTGVALVGLVASPVLDVPSWTVTFLVALVLSAPILQGLGRVR